MPYAFPADLASLVAERWQTLGARPDGVVPPLPAHDDLRDLLETAFLASLEREEGRELRFVLCCAPDRQIHRDGVQETVPLIPFRTPRPLTVESIRRLAPAVDSGQAAILVTYGAAVGTHEMAGVLHVGGEGTGPRGRRSFYDRRAPFALLIDARAPGELHIYQGGIKVAALKAGRLHDQVAFTALEFLPISDILNRGEAAIRPRIVSPRHEPARESSDFEWIALLSTILNVVNGVREHGHGGTVMLVAPGAESDLPIRTKYDLDTCVDLLDTAFVRFVNARHRLTETQRDVLLPSSTEDPMTLPVLRAAAVAAEERLIDAAAVVSALSAVDGALILTSDLRVLGFGAEIVLDATAPIAAHEVSGYAMGGGDWPAIDSESFGMRHRSALRGVATASDTAAFIISQDGTVSFCWKQDARLCLKRNVNTASSTMIG